jgi:hypothetical protein
MRNQPTRAMERGPQLDQRRNRPDDLDAGESARWELLCAELDRALDEGDGARALHSLAMLDRLRYGCR